MVVRGAKQKKKGCCYWGARDDDVPVRVLGKYWGGRQRVPGHRGAKVVSPAVLLVRLGLCVCVRACACVCGARVCVCGARACVCGARACVCGACVCVCVRVARLCDSSRLCGCCLPLPSFFVRTPFLSFAHPSPIAPAPASNFRALDRVIRFGFHASVVPYVQAVVSRADPQVAEQLKAAFVALTTANGVRQDRRLRQQQRWGAETRQRDSREHSNT